MTSKPVKLVDELRKGFSIRVVFAALIVTTISLILHVTWSFHQKSVLEKRIRDAVAYTLREPVRNHDLVTLKTVVKAFGDANAGADICLKLPDNVVMGDGCEESTFESYNVPLTNTNFAVGVTLPLIDKMVLSGLPLLFISMIIVFLITRYLRKLATSIQNDLEGVFSNGEKNLKYAELEDARLRVKEGLKLQEERLQIQTQALIGEVASQVAHDIASPLAALNLSLANLSSLPEENGEVARKALRRISDIASQLLQYRKKIAEEKKVVPVALFAHLKEILNEKKIQLQNERSNSIEIITDSVDETIIANVNPAIFSRVISNILNNSIEALEMNPRGKIIVSLKLRESFAEIEICDNGKGISPEVLSKVKSSGGSFGKEGGSGLGLKNAFVTIENWKGILTVRSDQNYGTTVTIRLPVTS